MQAQVVRLHVANFGLDAAAAAAAAAAGLVCGVGVVVAAVVL